MSVIKLDREAVNTLFGELGFENYKSWPHEKIVAKFAKLPGIVNEETNAESEEAKVTLTRILDGVENGAEFELTGDEPKAAPATKKDGKNKAAKEPKEKKAAKPKKEPVAVDEFGSREGTINAAFNAALTYKPQTMAELLKKAKLKPEQTRYNHVNKLIKEKKVKFVEKTDESPGGYCLPAKK